MGAAKRPVGNDEVSPHGASFRPEARRADRHSLWFQPPTVDVSAKGSARILHAMVGGDDTKQQVLVGISFPDIYRAQEFMTAALGMASRGDLVLEDRVLITKDDSGNTKVVETTDPQGGRSAISGAVWAGLVGLLVGGPVGWAAGMAAGAGAGALAAKVIDLGISDEWVEWFREVVVPGSAIVALLVTDLREDALVGEAKRFAGSDLVYANLDDGMLDRLAEALGDDDGPVARASDDQP